MLRIQIGHVTAKPECYTKSEPQTNLHFNHSILIIVIIIFYCMFAANFKLHIYMYARCMGLWMNL